MRELKPLTCIVDITCLLILYTMMKNDQKYFDMFGQF